MATDITEDMKVAAVNAIATIIPEEELREDLILSQELLTRELQTASQKRSQKRPAVRESLNFRNRRQKMSEMILSIKKKPAPRRG